MPPTQEQFDQLMSRVLLLEQFVFQISKTDRYTFEKMIQILDGRNIQLALGTGTKLGTAATQKLGFWGVTPVVQQARPTDAASIITAGTTIGIWA